MRPTIRRRTIACAIVCGLLCLLRADSNAVGAAPPGELDPTFSQNGKAITNFGGRDWASAVALQPDGRIVAVGGAGGDFGLARYNPDGSLDASFSDDGMQTTDFGDTADGASGVVLQSDGKIVAVGYAGYADTYDFALARYNPDGSLDAGFARDGMQTTDIAGEDAAFGVALQPDGKIVAVGYADGGFGDPLAFAVVRYNPDGSLDASFSGGVVTTDFGWYDGASSVALQADGKIVVAGWGDFDFALARYNPDGSLDASFSDDGMQTTHFNARDAAYGVALQPDGKIVAVGYGGIGVGRADFALARYNADGSLDASFSDDGRQITDFGGSDAAFGAAIEPGPDGKIIVAGSTCAGSTCDFALARYEGGSATQPRR